MGNEQSTQQSVPQEHVNGNLAEDGFSSTDEDTYKAPSKPQTNSKSNTVVSSSNTIEQEQAQKRKRRRREELFPMTKIANPGTVVAETPKAQMRQAVVQHDQPSSKKKRRGAKGGKTRRNGSSVATSSPSISRTFSHDEDVSVHNLDLGKELPAIPSWPQEEAVPMSSASQALRDREPEAFGEYARSESDIDEVLPNQEKETRVPSPVRDKATGEDEQDHESEVEEVESGANNEKDSPRDESTSEQQPSTESDDGDAEHSAGAHAKRRSGQTPREPQRVANGRFLCPYAHEFNCDKTFGSKKNANRHADAIHLKTKTFNCPICNTTFHRLDRLKSHQQNKHPASDAQNLTAAAEARPTKVKNGAKALEVDKSTSVATERLHELNSIEQETGPRSSSEEAVDDEAEPPEPVSETADTADTVTASQSLDAGHNGPVNDLGGGLQSPVEEAATEVVTGLKRKRGLSTANQAGLQTPKTYARKRRTTDMNLSPSTSPEPEETRLGTKAAQVNGKTSSTILNPPTKTTRTSSESQTGPLDRHLKPMSLSSQGRHPLSNLHSPNQSETDQQVRVVLPQSGHATSSSTGKNRSKATTVDRSQSRDRESPSLVDRLERRNYTTRNGKDKANPGVEYSSPQKAHASESQSESSDADSEPHQIATSIATRTNRSSSILPRKARVKSRSVRASGADTHTSDVSVYEDAPESTNSKGGEAKVIRPAKRTKSYDDNQPGDHVRKGQFSSWETHKLNKWRDDFCAEYEICEYEFNDMMTQSCRRGKQYTWGWRFITKEDFLKNYYDILPDRDRRSMHRYRERHFQNVVSHQDWTPEDDKELEELVAQWGTKWVEIGQQMGRTQDAVNQRYRNRVRDGGNLKRGEWDEDEVQKLRDAVAEVKSKVGLSSDEHSDIQIPWDAVKNVMGGIRTAQQCSNKWRLLFHLRKGGKFIKAPPTIRDRISGPEHRTPSKMDLRLNAQTPSSSAKKRPHILSEAFVQNSDEEDEVNMQEIPESKRPKSADLQVDDEEEINMQEIHDSRPSESGDSEMIDVAQVPESSQQQRSTEENTGEATDNDEENAAVPDSTGTIPNDERAATQVKPSAETPLVSRNPFTSRTPANQMSTSQAFNETQANTSARRTITNQVSRHMFSEARPSPNITMQYRPISSPLALIGGTQPAQAGDISSQLPDGNSSDDSDDSDDTTESRSEQPNTAGTNEQQSDSETDTSGDGLPDGPSIERRTISQSSPRLAGQTRAGRTYELSLNGSDTGRQRTPQQNRWNSVNGWQRPTTGTSTTSR